jgi:hypothetical protein
MRFGSIHGKPTERLYEITDELRYDGSFAELEPQLAGYDAIFVAGVNSHCRNGILKYCKNNSIPGFFLPHVGDVIMQEAEHVQSFDSPVLYVNRKELEPEYAIGKRLFDIVSSGLALILLLIAALLLVFPAVRQMGLLGFGVADSPQRIQQNAVQQAQDVADQINERIQRTGEIP